MTVTAPRKFSPRAGDPVPVTEREIGDSSGEFEGVPSPRETGPEPSTLHPETITHSDRMRRWLQAAKAYLTPPSVLAEPPPSYTELVNYAHHGAWTRHTNGPVRAAGIWWHRLVSLPITGACRYLEWIAQRPGRAIAVAVVVKLAALTGPGGWTVEHLIRPTLAAAAWVLL